MDLHLQIQIAGPGSEEFGLGFVGAGDAAVHCGFEDADCGLGELEVLKEDMVRQICYIGLEGGVLCWKDLGR